MKIQTTRILALSLAAICALSFASASAVEPVPFADNGGLKMLYDNRMYRKRLPSKIPCMTERTKLLETTLALCHQIDNATFGFSEICYS